MKRHRWFDVITFNSKKVKKLLENKIHHSYLEKYINKPYIDLDKIATLLLIFDEVDLSKQKKYDYIISVMLVQIALDTHELVTNESRTITDDIERQLSVLAGDYYSGLYYKTLSDLDEIFLIKVLANAIKQINEKKMQLYKLEVNSWHELINIIGEIESLLYTNVAECYEFPKADLQFISEILLVNRLIKEVDNIESNQFSYIQQYVEQKLVTPSNSSLIYSLETEIDEHQEIINCLMKQISYPFNQLKGIVFNNKMLSAVEEG